MHVERHAISITTDASGDGTGYTTFPVSGRVLAVRYVKTDYADGVDVTITCETSGMAVLTLTNQNSSGTFMPRGATHDTAGAAALYAAGGAAVNGDIPIAIERLKIVVAAGGNTKVGVFHVYIG